MHLFGSLILVVYTYEVLPLKVNAPPSFIRMMKTQNDPSASDVVDRFFQITDFLKNLISLLSYYQQMVLYHLIDCIMIFLMKTSHHY